MGLENPIHLALLLMIVLLVFGAKRLPEMGRSLGTGLRGFKEAVSGEQITELPTVAAMSDTDADTASAHATPTDPARATPADSSHATPTV
ncbi:MAG TPA: twin-arginine translocase TatA/TatE family subunit [Solirubrobacteraceae bacterium]|jgi:sec-independent protein translocase protein TatA|nr:twin-arginine translocase TatA/TatE family subunit [Solirubrobacteraceae bacterium]